MGEWMHEFIATLFPICRSITGDGLRATLHRIGEHIPLSLVEVPTGTRVFDWTVPREWNISDAYIKNVHGDRVVDFQRSSLHVVGYSAPIHRVMSLAELRPHLFTLPEHPDWIPYRTSYYSESWGFCLTERQLESLQDQEYEVCINSSLTDGSLTYAECYLPGLTDREVLISCHACHPALCNDNLSGIAVSTALAMHLLSLTERRNSYRFLFLPTVIGPITWLALNEEKTSRIDHGLVVACVGDPGKLTYKRSRRGNAIIDRVVSHVLSHSGDSYGLRDFSPYGYDERQYCSPGFDLPVGCLMRTPNGQFPEYHTSADNLDFVTAAALEDSLQKCTAIIDVLEQDGVYINQNPKCEPQLGRRGVYRGLGGASRLPDAELALLWVLNLADGSHSLLDIAERAAMSFKVIRSAANTLLACGLLREDSVPTTG